VSDSARAVLASFERLPAAEQDELLVALLYRTPGRVSDEALTEVADALLSSLDAEEERRAAGA